MSKTFKILLETAIVGGVMSSFSSSFAENETQEDQEQNSEEMISTLTIKKSEYAKPSLLKKPSSNIIINSNGIIKLSDTSSTTTKSSFEISGPPNSVAWLVVQNQVELKNGDHFIKVEISKNIEEKVNTGSDGKIILDLSSNLTKIDENIADGIYSGFCTITVTY